VRNYSFREALQVYAVVGRCIFGIANYKYFYMILFLVQQDLGKRLLRTKFFKPDVVLVTNLGYGNLKQPLPDLIVPQVKTMNKGFFESGLMLNNVISSALSGIGVGAFYRYGAYSLPKRKDNLKFKMTATIAF
jgi:hypothetical protein